MFKLLTPHILFFNQYRTKYLQSPSIPFHCLSIPPTMWSWQSNKHDFISKATIQIFYIYNLKQLLYSSRVKKITEDGSLTCRDRCASNVTSMNINVHIHSFIKSSRHILFILHTSMYNLFYHTHRSPGT